MSDQTRVVGSYVLTISRQNQLLLGTKPQAVSSDPIQDFTSSPMHKSGDGDDTERMKEPSAHQETSEDDSSYTHGPEQDKEEKQGGEQDGRRRTSLAEAKRRALESMKSQNLLCDSEEDDLEVVQTGDGTGLKRDKHVNAYEKKLAAVAGFRAGHRSTDFLEGSQGDKKLKSAAKSVFLDSEARRTKVTLDHRNLQAAILSKAAKQSQQITREKEEEWIRRGGKLAGKQRAGVASEPLSLDHLAQELAQGRRNVESLEKDATCSDSGSQCSSDEEWQPPERGSMSPVSRATAKGSGDESDNLEHTDELDEDEEHNNTSPTHLRPFRSTKLMVVSDSEEEETNTHQARGRVLVPDTSIVAVDRVHRGPISSESGLDETNKENDTPQPFDSGDDKENAMVISQSTPSRTGNLRSRPTRRSIGTESRTRQLSMSPNAELGNDGSHTARRPLQTRKISATDSPITTNSSSAANFGSPGVNRASSATGSPTCLRPAFGSGVGGLTQLFNDDEGIVLSDAIGSSRSPLQPAFRLQMHTGEGKSSSTREPAMFGGLPQVFSSVTEVRCLCTGHQIYG